MDQDRQYLVRQPEVTAAAASLSARMTLVALSLILVYSLAAAWVFEIWAMLVAQAAIFAVTVFIGCVWMRHGIWPVHTWLWLPLAGGLLWGLLQLHTDRTVDRFVTGTIVVRLASVVCAIVLASYAFTIKRNIRIFRALVLLLGIALALLAMSQLFTTEGRIYWTIQSDHTQMPMGPFLSRDSYASFIELVLPIALWRAAQPGRNWLFIVFSAIMYVSVIASLSRAGSVLVSLEVLGVPLAMVVSQRRESSLNTVWRAFATTAIIITLTSLFGWQELLKRFDTEDLWQIRRDYFRSSVAMVRDHPLFGSGLGTWPIVYPRFALMDMTAATTHAHNDWIEWASDGGIPFFLLMLVPVVHAAKQAFRHPWGLGIIAMALHALVDFPFQIYSLLLLFFLLVAALEVESSQPRIRRHRTASCSALV